MKYELKGDPAGTASIFIVGPDETLIQVSTRMPRDCGYAIDLAKRIADALNGESSEVAQLRADGQRLREATRELREGDGVYYVAQEKAFAPGIADGWPAVIPAPHSKSGRLVKRVWPKS